MEIVGATETFRFDVTQTGTRKLAGMTFGATYVKFDQDIQTDKKVDGRDVSEDGKRLDEHLANKQNPHGVTLNQLGPLSTDGKTLTASGNVGIGTAPDAKARLKVEGSSMINGSRSSSRKRKIWPEHRTGPEGYTRGISTRQAPSAAVKTGR